MASSLSVPAVLISTSPIATLEERRDLDEDIEGTMTRPELGTK